MERGGAWRRTLRRRSYDRVVPLMPPCLLTVHRADPATTDPGETALTLTGVVAVDGTQVTFTATPTATAGLTAGRYQFRVTVTDALVGTVVLVRGYLAVRDAVEG